MKKKLIFDVDGIMIDTYTRLEQYIQNYVSTNFTTPEFDVYKNFEFATFCSDFNLSGVKQEIKNICFEYWHENIDFVQNPMPMYDNIRSFPSTSEDNLWQFVSKPMPNYNKRTSFLTWRKLICFLFQYYNIEIHTQMYSERLADARRLFFNNLFSGYEFTKIDINIDVGHTKEKSEGYILVEDNLSNVLNANCEHLILRHLWHNSKDNLNNYKLFIAKNRPINCYGTFSQLCDILFSYISKDFNIPIDQIMLDWSNYNPDKFRRKL